MMLLDVLFQAGNAAVAPVSGAPSLVGPVAFTGHAGVCPGIADPASLLVSWNVTNPDDANYELRVLENGAPVLTGLCSVTTYSKTISDFVQAGSFHRFTSNWTYTVQLVRKADGVVISSLVSSAWTRIYGTCSNAL